uniref:SFRICE_012197 n=1 Tax=Spodoptera frugiperda TaxID=7108 RepID=A0A2H1VJW8_SPOFR
MNLYVCKRTHDTGENPSVGQRIKKKKVASCGRDHHPMAHRMFKAGHPSKPPRTREEMTSEAAFLREELKKMHSQETTSV